MAFESISNSDRRMAAPELSEKPKERKKIESTSISSSEGWTAWVGRRTEGLNLLAKDFQSTELSSSSRREFVITAKAFKEMIPTDSDKSVVLSDDFHDSAMEVSILVAGDDMCGNLKDILLMRYGFPSDKVIIRDSIYFQESLKLDWSNVCQAKLSFWLLRAEIETKSARPFPFDYAEIHEDDCFDVARKFVSLIGMDIESLIINYLRGTHVVDTLELEAGHYDHERVQNLRSLLKKEDCGFAEIEGLINKLGEVMKILSSNATRDLVSALRNIAKSFRMIVHMLRQLHQRTLDTGITWPVNWKGIEDTEGHFGILSLMIRDKVDQEKEALACETAYKSKSNKIFAALVVMRNWLFYVEGEMYRLVLALQSKISLEELTSALRSLKEGKQEILPFVVYRILAMHPAEESGNGVRYLDEMMSSNITKSILHVVSKLDTILSSLKIPIASIISWEELVACEKSLQEVETELKEIESNRRRSNRNPNAGK
ncbi:hypothetical protein SLEP1_g42214 [Rubroshorea leprosula]|uniref:Uncharacterized protein n=1 Tax=Rubroshorea leprosula TaxID=152421 RepID=A0AAV5L927_9ROSI|nr:hypothetical protein SLEP1_g42214 [Rubroshorea leprosula]